MKKSLLLITISLILLTGCTKKENLSNDKTTEQTTTGISTTTTTIEQKDITTTKSTTISTTVASSTTKKVTTTKELQPIQFTTKTTAKAGCSLPSESEAYNILMGKKSIYPDGTPWDINSYFQWKGGIYISGKGSIAFAFMLSDAAFGGCEAKKTTNFGNIKIGDIVVLNGERDSFIVLKVNADSYTIAEGNYNGEVKWERLVTKSEVQSTADFVLTRW